MVTMYQSVITFVLYIHPGITMISIWSWPKKRILFFSIYKINKIISFKSVKKIWQPLLGNFEGSLQDDDI